MIEIVGLSKTYAGTGRPALNDVSLHVPGGAVYGILTAAVRAKVR